MSEPLQLFDALEPHIEAALRASIERFGVLVPVARDQHGRTIDGHHRARIATELGVAFRVDTIVVKDDEEAREIARTLNSDRRHLSREQRQIVVASLAASGHSPRAIAGALGVSLRTVQKDEDQLTTSSQLIVPDRRVGLDGKSRPATRPSIVASKNLREADKVAQVLEALPMEAGETLTAHDVFYQARQQGQQANLQSSAARVPLPAGKYRVILADPPWQYDFVPTANRAIENQYGTLDVVEIAAYRDPGGRHVSDLAADDSVLFMWATAPKLREAFTVMDGWGFEYVTHMVWVKDRIGMGYWARSQHELLLIGRRGSVSAPPEHLRRSSVFDGRRAAHSVKPSLHEWIEQAFPGGGYVELFSRLERDGWVSFGNQVAA